MHVQALPVFRAPFYGVRAQGPMAGPGPPQRRRCIHRPMKDRWTQTLALHAQAAAAATDRRTSRLLYDPFRVEAVTFQTDAALTDAVFYQLATDNIGSGAAAGADQDQSGLWQAVNEGLRGNEVTPMSSGSTFPIGTVFRNVPTRLVLVFRNGTAGALDCLALVTVTFLMPVADDVEPWR